MFNQALPLKTALLATVLPIALGISACSDSNDDDSVDIEDIKSHYVTMADAVYSDSLTTAETLQVAVSAFIMAPTEQNLATAKTAYKEARIPYQQSEIMRWDTSITIAHDLSADGGPASVDEWEGQVNAWPLDENHIVTLIEGTAPINTALLIAQNGVDDNEANVTTGVHAVEFMLWGEDANGVNPGAGERPAADFANDGSCADAFCERRADYLQAAIDLLVDDLTIMANEWTASAETTQGTLAYNFLNSNAAIDYIVGSIRSMASDELASARMGSGLTLGDPEESHDCFSDLSHVAIYNNFQGVRNAFYGRYNGISGPSLANLVRHKDLATFIEIDDAFNSIEGKMRQIFEAGEQEPNPIRFDQIIGQDASGIERQIAEAAVSELIALDAQFNSVKELLSLSDVATGGEGD